MAAKLPVGLFQTDAAGSCVYVNSRWRELTGLTAQEALGAGWARALHPDDRERVFAAWTRAANAAEPFAGEYRFLHPDGAIVWVYGQAMPEVNERGDVVAFVGSVTDITAGKRAEENLRRSEERYRTLVERIDQGFCLLEVIHDDDGRPSDYRFLEVNPAFERHTGLKGAVGRTARELVPNLENHWVETYGALAETGEPHRFEQHSPAMGRWFEVDGVRVGGERSNKVALLFADVTERKRADDAVRESERRLQLLADAMPQVVWVAGPDGAVRYYNNRVTDFAAVAETPQGAWDWRPIVHPDDLPATLDAWHQAVREKAPYAQEHRILMSDGRYCWHLSRAVPIFSDHGEIETWYGTATDIHELKQAEIERRENEERLRLGIEVAGFALAEIDYAQDVIHLSAEAARLYGLGNDAVTLPRDRVHAAFHPDDREELKRRIAVTPDPNAEPSYTTEYRVRWPTGEVRWLSVRKQIIFDRSSVTPRPVRAMLAALDITARVRAEEDRQALLDALAHDLKNPLTAMKMQAQLLLRQIDRQGIPDRDALTERVASFAALATRMSELIDELAEHARVALGVGLTPDRRPTDLVALARGSVAETLRTDGLHGIRLETAETELVGNWDEGQLRRVLENLLSNAVKYSPPGSEIQVLLGRDGRYATLHVRDAGIGIPSSDLQHVFAFRRRGGNVGAITGSGVGLAGVKQIVEQHGGMVSVHSVEERGSTFTVRLPLAGHRH